MEVRAAGINPTEAVIRSGALHYPWPARFPSGQGSDLTGVVTELGPGVSGSAVGDEVIGFSMRRSSQPCRVRDRAGESVDTAVVYGPHVHPIGFSLQCL